MSRQKSPFEHFKYFKFLSIITRHPLHIALMRLLPSNVPEKDPNLLSLSFYINFNCETNFREK
jgi:hypothetical protein